MKHRVVALVAFELDDAAVRDVIARQELDLTRLESSDIRLACQVCELPFSSLLGSSCNGQPLGYREDGSPISRNLN